MTSSLKSLPPDTDELVSDEISAFRVFAVEGDQGTTVGVFHEAIMLSEWIRLSFP